MKKTVFFALILGMACIACTKEPEAPVNVETTGNESISINAYVVDGDIVKTSYTGDSYAFSWTGDECISMQLIKKSDSSRDRWVFYNETEAGGTTAVFKSSGTLNTDTWGIGEYAFYPYPGNSNCPARFQGYSFGSVYTNKTASGLVLDNSFNSSVSNPLRIVPMVGVKDAESNFAFHSLTGILMVTVTGIDSRLDKVQLYSNGQKLNGTFTMSGDAGEEYIAMTTSSTASENVINAYYSDKASETELAFYFPVPVGTLNENFQIRLLDSSSNVLYSVKCPSSINIVRNRIAELTKKIALPAEDFSATVTAGGTSAAITASVAITKDATSVKAVLASSEAAGESLIDAEDASVVSFADGETKALPMTNISASGTAYIVAKTFSGSTAKLSYNVPVYVLTAADAASLASQYVRDVTVGSTSLADLDVHGDNTITFEVSDDPSKGNIMITEFAGFTYTVTNHTFTTWSRSWDSFTAGDPVYGLYGDSIVYGGNTGAEFYNLTSQIFYTDSSNSKHIIGTIQSSLSTLKFAFNSDGYSSGTVHDLVVWNPYIGNCWNASLTSYDFYFNQYVANKTKGRVAITKDMLSTNTSYGEDGSGDAGGMAALIDMSSGTYWHSNWRGSVVTDAQGVYLQIDLTSISKTVNSFTLKFLSRSNITHGLPTKYKIAVSKNGTDWTDVTEEVSITAAANKWYQKSVSAGDDYSYIRLCITESDRGALTSTADGTYYTHMAELQLWED